jgi:hypothetical protein
MCGMVHVIIRDYTYGCLHENNASCLGQNWQFGRTLTIRCLQTLAHRLGVRAQKNERYVLVPNRMI